MLSGLNNDQLVMWAIKFQEIVRRHMTHTYHSSYQIIQHIKQNFGKTFKNVFWINEKMIFSWKTCQWCKVSTIGVRFQQTCHSLIKLTNCPLTSCNFTAKIDNFQVCGIFSCVGNITGSMHSQVKFWIYHNYYKTCFYGSGPNSFVYCVN